MSGEYISYVAIAASCSTAASSGFFLYPTTCCTTSRPSCSSSAADSNNSKSLLQNLQGVKPKMLECKYTIGATMLPT